MKSIAQNTPYTLRENVSGGAAASPCVFSYRVTPRAYEFTFSVTDAHIFSPYNTDNETVYKADAVEVFFCPDGNRNQYLELEASPKGVRFFADIRNGGGSDYRLTINLLPPAFALKTQITNQGYRSKLTLPLSAMQNYDAQKCLLNAYRLDYDAFGALTELQALQPTLCDDFHRPDFFVHPLAEN